MRTTLNLDDDVAARIAELAERRGSSLSRSANELLRAGLRSLSEVARPEPYKPPVFDSGRPLIDVTDVGSALETLDDT